MIRREIEEEAKRLEAWKVRVQSGEEAVGIIRG